MRYQGIDDLSAKRLKIRALPYTKYLNSEPLCVELDDHWDREFKRLSINLRSDIQNLPYLDAAQFHWSPWLQTPHRLVEDEFERLGVTRGRLVSLGAAEIE